MQRLHRRNIIWLMFTVLVYAVIALMLKTGVINSFHALTINRIMLDIIYAMGLNLILGVAGQFSLGHAGFIAIGAYSSAILTKMYAGTNPYMGLAIGMAVGVVIAIVVALLVGIPTLRLKGDYLAIATLGVSEIIRVVINNLEVTNGPAGISGIPRLTNFHLLYWVMVVTMLIILNFTYSSAGRATHAIEQDEIAAEAMGVQVTKYKVLAFVLGAITAAMAGTLQATFLGVVIPSDYTFNKSIDILIIVVFGGIGSFTGTIIAAILLGFINLVLQGLGLWRMVVYALALICIMIFRPEGLLGKSEFRLGRVVDRWLNKRQNDTVETEGQ